MAANGSDSGLGSLLLIGLMGWGFYSWSDDRKAEKLAEEYGIDEQVAEEYLAEADGNYDAAAYNYDIAADQIEFGNSIQTYENSPADYQNTFSSSTYGIQPEEREDFDEYEAKREAEREMERRGYNYAYGCTIDCSGHEAGWSYRADTGYSTGIGQYGKSQSFDEGARAFEEAVDDRVEEMREAHESGEDPY